MDSFRNPMLLFFFFFVGSLPFSTQNEIHTNTSFSLSFPLTSLRISPKAASSSSSLRSSFISRANRIPGKTKTPSLTVRSVFKYSRVLIVSLPIGTPPQRQQMLLDTGSQLSWIQCHDKKKKAVEPKKANPPTASFDPSLSSSFSVLPCTHPLCKPRIRDFTLPTDCDQNRLCHYSYFYADGSFAEGNLVREKFTFSSSQSTLPLILGCAKDATEDKGILGMNLGRLSFASQAKITKFSYCVPPRPSQAGLEPTGSFYLGHNPKSAGFKYVNLLTSPQSQRSPNFDPLAYSVPLQGIRIGAKKLDIPAAAFRPDATGSGQTIIDSGSEYTYLADAAYNKVREEVVRRVGPKLKKGYVHEGVLDMCFDGNPAGIGRLIGDMALEFEKGVEILIPKESVLTDVGRGVHCVALGRSDMLGIASNIIGNIHQQNLWIEFDLTTRRVGFGKADCSRSL